MKSLPHLLSLTLLTLLPMQAAQFPFLVRVQEGASSYFVDNQSAYGMPASNIGATSEITVQLTYRGISQVVLDPVVNLIGSTDFKLTAPQTATTLKTGESVSLRVVYTARTADSTVAQLSWLYTESPDPGSTAGTASTVGAFALQLVGTAPQPITSYYLQSDGNVVPLVNGAAIVFQPTAVNSQAGATFTIGNRGSGPASIESISLSGDDFQILGIPYLPLSLTTTQSVNVVIRYSPKKLGTSQGQLKVRLGGVDMAFPVSADAIGSAMTYTVITASGETNVAADGLITLPATEPGKTSSVLVRVQNSGTADASIPIVGIIGTNYSVTDVPLVPITLTPGQSFLFTLNFQPLEPGTLLARLRIGNDTIGLTGTGVGQKLEYSFRTGSNQAPVLANGTVLLPAVMVSQKSAITFAVKNTGTAAAAINAIGVAETRSAFTASGLPSLPLSLAPGAIVEFSIQFSPVQTGLSVANLRVNEVNFLLNGFGSAPPALPAYQFQGTSGAVDALQQIPVGITLSQTYPVSLSGTLTLTVNSGNLNLDPSVQFATGGRTVAFTIPANAKDAIFPNGTNRIRFQTGTLAAGFTLTPVFATSDGGVDVTPASPTVFQATLATAAPRLVQVKIESQTATGFVVAVTGLATGQNLTAADVTFTAAAGYNMPDTKVSIDLSQQSATWFRSTTAASYGGQFTVRLPFQVRSSDSAATNLLASLQSISVVLRGQEGSSSAGSIVVTQ